jgi:hypothetical protein
LNNFTIEGRFPRRILRVLKGVTRISISNLADGSHDGFLHFFLSLSSEARNDQWRIYFFFVVVLLVVDRSGPAIPAGDFGKMFFRVLISLSPRSNFLNIPMVIFFYGLNEVVEIETLRRATRREFVFLCRVFFSFFFFHFLLCWNNPSSILVFLFLKMRMGR